MTQYQYVAANGEHYQGLPMIDLDDADLTDDQIALLALATERGYYKTVQDLVESGETVKAQSLILADIETGEQISGAKANDEQSNRTDSNDGSGSSDDTA